MPSMARIRFTNVVYEGGAKRYTDSTFIFEGQNSALVLENGGGKTVFIQAAIQAVLPHADVAGRKIKDTLTLENGPAHIAIEWIIATKPKRQYLVTCVSLFMSSTGLDSLRYCYTYSEKDDHDIAKIPLTKDMENGLKRVTDRGEIQEYYHSMQQKYPLKAKVFATIKEYQLYLEENYQIISSEWQAIAKINANEGGIEQFFSECKTSTQLVDRLLIPMIEESMSGHEQGQFTKMFVAQREGFQRTKELRDTIEENQHVREELDKYVKVYRDLHDAKEQYDLMRRKGKAFRSFVECIDNDFRQEKKRLEAEIGVWQQEDLVWHQKRDTLSIAKEKENENQWSEELAELTEKKSICHEELLTAKRYRDSLKYAKEKEKQSSLRCKIEILKQQLADLDKTQEQEELDVAWKTNAGQLRAYFLREKQRLDERVKALLQSISDVEKAEKGSKNRSQNDE
nr:hypothetical protein [Bacilli bacterium]